MSSRYFQNFPLINYWFDKKGPQFFVRHIFRRVDFLRYLRENEKFFDTYVANAEDRPEVVAHKVYGDSYLFWLVMMANDVIDLDDWVMSSSVFDDYMKSKYTDQEMGQTKYYTFDGIVVSPQAQIIQNEKNPFGTYSSVAEGTDPSQFSPVSVAQYEAEQNDSKRIIRILKPRYIPVVLREIETKLQDVK